jgi:hypothetical protein
MNGESQLCLAMLQGDFPQDDYDIHQLCSIRIVDAGGSTKCANWHKAALVQLCMAAARRVSMGRSVFSKHDCTLRRRKVYPKVLNVLIFVLTDSVCHLFGEFCSSARQNASYPTGWNEGLLQRFEEHVCHPSESVALAVSIMHQNQIACRYPFWIGFAVVGGVLFNMHSKLTGM